MKKTYLTPKVIVAEFDTEMIMAGSDGSIDIVGGSGGGSGVSNETETDARDRFTNGLFDWN